MSPVGLGRVKTPRVFTQPGSNLAVPLTSGGGLLSGVKLKKHDQKLTLGSKVGLPPAKQPYSAATSNPLPPRLKAELGRALDRIELVRRQIAVVEAERDALVQADDVRARSPAVLLMQLRGIGPEFATVLWMEGLFRNFTNRRQLAAYAGLAPSPWKSGCVDREQGIAKSGNPRLRTTMVELAWLWLRYQPDSALSRWFRERVGSERGRIRRIAIVALARKLLVALWRYTTLGDLPAGAALKTA